MNDDHEALHREAAPVACDRRPRGCGAPAWERCVNWSINRAEGEHPPAMKVPHISRLVDARRAAAIPAPRQLEAAEHHLAITADWTSA